MFFEVYKPGRLGDEGLYDVFLVSCVPVQLTEKVLVTFVLLQCVIMCPVHS